MSRVENVHTDIWEHPAFEGLSAAAKLVYFWTFSNARLDMTGIYRATPKTISAACSLDVEQVEEALRELQQPDVDLVAFDGEWLWCKARVKQISSKSPHVATRVVRDLARRPRDHPFFDAFLRRYGADDWLQNAFAREGIDTLSIPSPDPVDRVSNTAQTSHSQHPIDTLSIPSGEGSQGQGQGSSAVGVEEKEGGRRARAKSQRVDPNSLPAAFPEHLVAVVDELLSSFAQLHAERGGGVPTRRGIANAVKRFPDRDHRAVFADLEHWVTAGGGSETSISDWGARFRTFLEKAKPAAPSRPASGARPGSKNLNRFIQRG